MATKKQGKKSAQNIEFLPVSGLKPYDRNPRTHSDAQVKQIAASIQEFGFLVPVLIDAQDGVIAGHGRILAAQQLGMTEVPCLRAAHLTEAQRRAYIIADNKLTENAGWDAGLLRMEMIDLKELGADLGLIGFSTDELTAIFADPGAPYTEEDNPLDLQADAVTVLGDLWALGNHRLLCGDATKIEQVECLTAGVKVDMVCTDPPYGISIVQGATDGGAKPFGNRKGWVGGGEKYDIPFGGKKKQGHGHGPAKKAIIKPGRYDAVIGDDSTETARAGYSLVAALKIPSLVFWGGNYYADFLPPSRCWLVWDKENTGAFADVEMAWTNFDRPARLFRHMWNGLMKASERGQRRVHPTQKPIALGEWVFREFGKDTKTVMDLFLGSGSNLIAAETTGKTCLGMELSPHYTDVIIRRWQEFTGKQAVLEGDGRTFDELAAERLGKEHAGTT